MLHLVDTLDIGGAERVAVNVVNALPRDRYRASLCTTRRDGPLADLLAPDVGRLRLQRGRRFEWRAVRDLVAFLRTHRIRLLHAHGTALFLARVAAALTPGAVVIWHDHFGRYRTEQRPAWLYRWATAGVGGIIAVNHPLAAWARDTLHVSGDRVWYVPNFVSMPETTTGHGTAGPALPGHAETRIVCVANLRPQKDHLTLIAALPAVVAALPSAHLLIVGEAPDPAYSSAIRAAIAERRLDAHVSVLGPRQDVPAVLRACAVGVLSSASEGLPLALIEYGAAGLAAVATSVGECPEVLDHGRAGLLVPPGDSDALGQALRSVLTSPERRQTMAAALRSRVATEYGEAQGMRRICDIYSRVLHAPARGASAA